MNLSKYKLASPSLNSQDASPKRYWTSSDLTPDRKSRLITSKSVQKLKTPKKKSTNCPNLSPAPSDKSFFWPIPETPSHLKNAVRPNGLVSVRKSVQEKEIKPIDWVPPRSRLGFVGAMFAKFQPKTPMRIRTKERILSKEKILGQGFMNKETDQLYVEYKEPYLQRILEKKIKKISYSNVIRVL